MIKCIFHVGTILLIYSSTVVDFNLYQSRNRIRFFFFWFLVLNELNAVYHTWIKICQCVSINSLFIIFYFPINSKITNNSTIKIQKLFNYIINFYKFLLFDLCYSYRLVIYYSKTVGRNVIKDFFFFCRL